MGKVGVVVKVGMGVSGVVEDMVVEAAAVVEGMAEGGMVVAVNMEVMAVNVEAMAEENKVVI